MIVEDKIIRLEGLKAPNPTSLFLRDPLFKFWTNPNVHYPNLLYSFKYC